MIPDENGRSRVATLLVLPLRNAQPAQKSDNRDGTSLDIVSIFKTVQGEGPYVGHPAIFVRLEGCNLQCPLCFGTKTASRIPYLSLVEGASVRLDRVKKGEKILTFDTDFNLVETEVISVLGRKVGLWIEVKIAGQEYDVTPEHPFFTNRGLVSACELVVGDEILEARSAEIISYKKMGDKNPMKDPETTKKKVQNTDYESVGKKTSATRKRLFASGELRPSFYSLTPEQQEMCRKKQSEAKRRGKNPNWKGICPNLLDVQEEIDAGIRTKCGRCGEGEKRLLVHHQNGNHDDDTLTNLVVWCHQCHNQHHERGYNFWNGKRSDGKELIDAHNGQTVETIKWKKGVLPVVNISCAPYNTYLANGMWVHNCDTDYTSGQKRYLIEKIVETVNLLAKDVVKLVVITGGEPFRQHLGPLVDLLRMNQYLVQIETNGTLYDDSLDEPDWDNITVVCSPKAGLNFNLIPHIDCLKYVMRAGEVDPVDGLPTRVLESTARPGRPPFTFNGEIYLQPCDEGDSEKNEANMKVCVESCLKFGYLLCVQIHKIANLP